MNSDYHNHSNLIGVLLHGESLHPGRHFISPFAEWKKEETVTSIIAEIIHILGATRSLLIGIQRKTVV